jgi:hypothetical protein
LCCAEVDENAWGGRYRFSAISQPVVDALCVSFRSFPPKEAIVAVVLNDILNFKRGMFKKGLNGIKGIRWVRQKT